MYEFHIHLSVLLIKERQKRRPGTHQTQVGLMDPMVYKK
jgi:hypothetical protein